MTVESDKIKLCVATPMYAGQCFGAYMVSIMGLKDYCTQRGWGFKFIHIGNESLITRARNKLVEQFLISDSTHLLFIDADMEFAPELIGSLVDYNVEVVCGLCPKKQIRWDAVKDLVKNNPDIEPYLIPRLISDRDNNVNYFGNDETKHIEGLLSVKHSGTGCMLIQRNVFTKLNRSIPQFIDYGSDGLAHPTLKPLFFDTKVETHSHSYLSEDYYFCDEWRKIGGTIYLAPHIRLNHIGIHTFY